MAKDFPEKKKMKGGKEKERDRDVFGACESIKSSRNISEETHQIDYAPLTTNNAKQSEFCALSTGMEWN